jgi:hypothetical protein
VDVSSQPHVISQIVTGVVRIVIDHDVIVVPEPVSGVVIIVRRHLEEEAANVESIKSTAAQAPDVPRAKAYGKVSVLPGMVKVVVLVIAARIVANPAIIFSVDVRGLRVAFLVVIPGVVLLWRTPLLRRL